MKILVIFLSGILIFTVDCQRSNQKIKPQKKQAAISQQDFEKQLSEALEAQDTTKVTSLVKNNRYQVSSVMEQLNNKFFRSLLEGNNKEAANNLSRLKWLADLFRQIFEDDYFEKRLVLLQSWNIKQKWQKLKADSLRDQAKELWDNKNFENSEALNQKALIIYRDLGDKENEAQILNGLGLCYHRLRKFSQAEQNLRQALKINRQLGLKQNIMVNLNNIGDVYQKQRKFSQALNYFQQSLNVANEIGDESSAASKLSNIGDTYHRMNEVQQAKTYLEKALEISRRINDLPLQTIVLLNIGALYADMSDFTKAIDTWQQGLKIARQLKNTEKEGGLLSNLAMAYRNIGKYDDAQKTLSEALKLNIETRNRWTEGNTLREIGVNLYLKGQPDSAVVFWKRSLGVFQELADTSSMGILTGYIGIYYKNAGMPYKALSYYNQALELSRKTGNQRETSNILSNMGNVYDDLLAEYEKAEQLFEQALEIKKKIGEIHFAGVILGNLGTCYKNRGDYQKALESYFEALKLSKKTHNKSGEAKNLTDIGATYADVGAYQKAGTYYNKALAIFRDIGEVKPQIETLMNLGSNYLDLNNANSALANYKQALKLAQKINQQGFEGSIYYYLGNTYSKKSDYRKAMEYYDKSQQICERTFDLRVQGNLFTAKGDLYFERKDYPQALSCYNKGLQIGEKIGSLENIWKAYYGIGRTMEKKGKNQQAEKSYHQAIKKIESMRAKLKANTLKENFLKDKIGVYDSMINLLLKMGREKDAYEYLERSKARSFLDILSTSHFNIAKGIAPKRLRRKKDLERKLDKIHQRILSLYGKAETKRNQQQVAFWEDSLMIVRYQHQQLLQEIELKNPRYSDLIGIKKPLNLKQVQQKVLQPGTALIEYLVADENVIVWVIKEDFFTYKSLVLNRGELEDMVRQLLQPFKDVKEGRIKNFADIFFDLKLSQKLYRLIFQPIEPYLKNSDQLIIIPDDVLYYLPFEVLVTQIEKRKYDRKTIFSHYQDARFLIEKYNLSYAPSATVLEHELIEGKPRAKIERLLAFGNPDFGRASEIAVQQNTGKANDLFSMLFRSSRGLVFSPLPKTEEEVKSIANIIHPSTYYLEKNAKEETFKQQAGKYSILHLATHCIVDEAQPMYSKIVFAQDNDPAEDGFLNTYEVFNLQLNADLVNLSACETGLGKFSRGEGIIGLTRAFMYAGAPSVVVSLWSVSESTADLMKYFYTNLKSGMSKSQSLRQAKLKMIKKTGRFQNGQRFSFANPFLWAPFVLMGDWQ